MIRQLIKTLAIFFLMGVMVVHSYLLSIFVRYPWVRSRRRARMIGRYSAMGLWVLGVEVICRGQPTGGGSLYVGNHLSYLDVLIISAESPTVFVTSEEIRETPGLGFLCELGGCLFVERRSRARLTAEVGEITQALGCGVNVTVFPEATSTSGESVLRFRRPLFQSAVDSQRQVVPFCLNYESIDGARTNISTRDTVCWYGDMEFLAHLWALTAHRRIRVRLDWLDVIQPGLQSTPEILAEASHRQVANCFQPFQRPLFPDSSPERFAKVGELGVQLET